MQGGRMFDQPWIFIGTQVSTHPHIIEGLSSDLQLFVCHFLLVTSLLIQYTASNLNNTNSIAFKNQIRINVNAWD